MFKGLRDLARRMIILRARDHTDAAAGRSALVVAPHPDDETLGCGAVILRKLDAGTRVVVVIVTDGAHSHSSSIPPARLVELRREEMDEAARRLGLPPGDVRWLDIEDGTVTAREAELVAELDRLLAEVRPEEVYATSADEPHPDHAAVGRAARKAVAGLPGTALLEYPIWLWAGWPFAAGNRIRSAAAAVSLILRRGAVVVRTAGHSAGKLHALDAHRTQVSRPAEIPPHEPWEVLPQAVMDAAAADVELFLPVRREA